MSSSRANAVPTCDLLPCPECGAEKMARVVENCRLEDGLLVRRLRHFRCRACGTRFFDSDAMHCIQALRAGQAVAHAV